MEQAGSGRAGGEAPTPEQQARRRRRFERRTGVDNAYTTVAGYWPSLLLSQTATIAAQGSEIFVKQVVAWQSIGVVMLLVIMLCLRRNLAGRWQLVASLWVAVPGLAAVAIRPDRATLTAALVMTAWAAYATSTLRTAVSPRAGSGAPAAQSRVQTWMYAAVLVISLVYVAIGGSSAGWRVAAVLMAVALAYEGTRLIFTSSTELPDPRRERQPALHQPLEDVLTYWPLMWAIIILTLTFVMLGLYFTDLQTELSHVGWHASFASWIVAAAGASRVLTLWVAKLMTRAGKEHHGTALVWSAGLVAVAAALVAWPLIGGGRLTSLLTVAAGGIVLQAAMNGCNPVIRAYVGQRSVDASTLVNIGAAAGQAVGTQLAVRVGWSGVVAGWSLCTVAILALAIITVGHRYRVYQWDNTSGVACPDVPPVNEYWLRGIPADGGRIGLVIVPGGAARLPQGYSELPRRNAGGGERVRLLVPFDPSAERQYWQPKRLLALWQRQRALPLERWSKRTLWRPWTARAASVGSAAAREPVLVVTGDLEEALTFDEEAGRWSVSPEHLQSAECILAEGDKRRGHRVPFVTDEGIVRGLITSRRVTSWRVVRTLVFDGGPIVSTNAELPIDWIVNDPRTGSSRQCVLRLDQVDGVSTAIFNEVTSTRGFRGGYIEAWAHHF